MSLRSFARCLLGASLWLAVNTAFSGTLVLDGPTLQGALIQGRTDPGAEVTLDREAVRVSPEGIFLVGFHRDAPPKSVLEVTYPDGRREQRVLYVDQRQYQIQRVDGLPPRKVTPNPADLKRIRAETELVKKARSRDDPRTDFLTGFIWPTVGPISGVYGSQRILNGEPRQPHYGIDVAVPTGTPVVAPADGVVTLAHPDLFFSGGTLVVDHGHGLSSSFLHLSRIVVREGERVRQGQKIAEVGATGRVTGAHLDWRINLFDKRLDPQLIAGPMPPR